MTLEPFTRRPNSDTFYICVVSLLRKRSCIDTGMTTHYEILGIPREASAELVKRSYRRLVKIHHPDRFPSGTAAQAEAEKRIREINAAYWVLSKPIHRANYDAQLGKRTNSCSDAEPEYYGRCGKPTGYWGTVKRAARCHACS